MHRRIKPALDENFRKHGGRRRLAVRTADADGARIVAHQLSQQLRAFHRRNMQPLRFGAFGVRQRNRRGIDHQIRAVDILRAVADGYFRARLPHVVHQIPVILIRACHLIPQMLKHLSQTRHTGATDANHMDAFTRKILNLRRVHNHSSLLRIQFRVYYTLSAPE